MSKTLPRLIFLCHTNLISSGKWRRTAQTVGSGSDGTQFKIPFWRMKQAYNGRRFRRGFRSAASSHVNLRLTRHIIARNYHSQAMLSSSHLESP
jgi:hypothetical protein